MNPLQADTEATLLATTLINLVYVSSATRTIDQEELVAILRVAREHNAKEGITGMLLHKDGNFMQVLEGPADAVHRLSAKVESDPRHHGFLVLINRPISERQFADWSMAFHNVEDAQLEAVSGVSSFLSNPVWADSFRNKPVQAFKLLLSFRDNMR